MPPTHTEVKGQLARWTEEVTTTRVMPVQTAAGQEQGTWLRAEEALLGETWVKHNGHPVKNKATTTAPHPEYPSGPVTQPFLK